jgi:hypothetical protein
LSQIGLKRSSLKLPPHTLKMMEASFTTSRRRS